MTQALSVIIRELVQADCDSIAGSFAAQDWNKPPELFKRYLIENSTGKRTVLIAEVEGRFAGYLTIDWRPEYPVFKEHAIPEIADFNVLIGFQRQGVGTRMMDSAEKLISQRSNVAGIRVGLTADYGSAQRLYVKREYVPDGNGISQRGKFLRYGDTAVVDDDLTLGFTKSLR
jgi:ribosomal protein S18 acetylase RimI-like enzyme